jgi:hypothetical protein
MSGQPNRGRRLHRRPGDNHGVPAQPVSPSHRVIAAHVHAVPAPFRSFAVRSEEPQHACQARAPYGWVHVVRTAFLDDRSRASLVAAVDGRVRIEAFSDIDYLTTTPPDLAAAAPRVGDLARHIASALQMTGELLISDEQWSVLGAPWLPVEDHEQRAALDLMVAEFDDRSGAVKRVRTLRDSMKRSTCHVDVA